MKKGKFILTLRDTKSEKQEVYFSEKELKAKQTYQIVIASSETEGGNLHKV